LYRGTSGADEYIAASWDTRKVKDSSPDAQVLFDQLLTRMGMSALRRNSIFAISDYDHAAGFGDEVWVIFPIDGHSTFTYTKFRDLTINDPSEVGVDDTKIQKFKKQLLAHLESPDLDVPHHSDIKYMADSSWTGDIGRLLAAIADHAKKGNKWRLPDQIVNAQLIDFASIAKFKKVYNPQNTNLAKALKQELEVCVSGGYYALRTGKYHAWLESHYGVKVQGWYS
jgi:hypothetical protein